MTNTEWIILGGLTLANFWFSWWVSLRQRRYHGISRFLSFQTLIILMFIQYTVWFKNPLAWFQLISWTLLAGSALVAFFGFYQFYKFGRPSDGMEETTRLIKSGFFAYIRHPLYLSLILGGFGIMMKDPGCTQILLGLFNFLFVYITARIEEGEMIRKFGDEYAQYMKKTKMFIPFIL